MLHNEDRVGKFLESLEYHKNNGISEWHCKFCNTRRKWNIIVLDFEAWDGSVFRTPQIFQYPSYSIHLE